MHVSNTFPDTPPDGLFVPGADLGAGAGAAPVHVLAGYITAEQLAAALGVSVRTIQRWEAQRVGPPRVVIGQMVLFNVTSIRKWLAANESEPVTKPRRAGRR